VPKRSNAFQRAVRFIYQQLMGNVEVPESMFLTDRLTGTEREVDVVIEKDVAGHHLILSIECVGRSRRASVEWVDQMASKHQSLPTNHLVLISEKGFTSEAMEKAAKLGIEALTPEEAIDVDWTTVVKKLAEVYAALYTATTLNCRIEWAEAYEDTTTPVHGAPTDVLYGNDGQSLGTLESIIQTFIRPRMGDVLRQIDEDGERILAVGLPCPEGSYLADANGERREPKALHYTLRVVRFNTTAVPLRHQNLKGVQVAYGELGPPFAKEGTIVIIEQEGAPLSAEIRGKFEDGETFAG
jgi:hypothetical protein